MLRWPNKRTAYLSRALFMRPARFKGAERAKGRAGCINRISVNVCVFPRAYGARGQFFGTRPVRRVWPAPLARYCVPLMDLGNGLTHRPGSTGTSRGGQFPLAPAARRVYRLGARPAPNWAIVRSAANLSRAGRISTRDAD